MEEKPEVISEVMPAEKSSKKPLIIATAAIATTVLALIAIVLLLVFRPFAHQDAVPAAVSKLFTEGAPKNVQMTGLIKAYSNNDSDSTELTVDFDASFNNVTTENSVTAKVSAALPGGESLSFNADEIHTASGNLYLKLNGAAKAIKKFGVDGIEVFETIDDEWVQIPDSNFSNLTDIMPNNTIVSCLTGAAGNLSEYGTNFVKLYQANPFIEYSTDNISIEKKRDTLYRLSFNGEKLTAFVNSMNNSGFANELLACTGSVATNEDVTMSDLDAAIKALPTIYVEINNNYEFTRVYLIASNSDGTSGATADISFTYPSTDVTVTEPKYYISLSEFLQQLLSDFYGTDITE